MRIKIKELIGQTQSPLPLGVRTVLIPYISSFTWLIWFEFYFYFGISPFCLSISKSMLHSSNWFVFPKIFLLLVLLRYRNYLDFNCSRIWFFFKLSRLLLYATFNSLTEMLELNPSFDEELSLCICGTGLNNSCHSGSAFLIWLLESISVSDYWLPQQKLKTFLARVPLYFKKVKTLAYLIAWAYASIL